MISTLIANDNLLEAQSMILPNCRSMLRSGCSTATQTIVTTYVNQFLNCRQKRETSARW